VPPRKVAGSKVELIMEIQIVFWKLAGRKKGYTAKVTVTGPLDCHDRYTSREFAGRYRRQDLKWFEKVKVYGFKGGSTVMPVDIDNYDMQGLRNDMKNGKKAVVEGDIVVALA